MPISDENNLKQLEAALKRAGLPPGKIPDCIKQFEKQLKAANLQKDFKKKCDEVFEKNILAATLKAVEHTQNVLAEMKTLVKTVAELRTPAMPTLRIPDLKVTSTIDTLVFAVGAAEAALRVAYKIWKNAQDASKKPSQGNGSKH